MANSTPPELAVFNIERLERAFKFLCDEVRDGYAAITLRDRGWRIEIAVYGPPVWNVIVNVVDTRAFKDDIEREHLLMEYLTRNLPMKQDPRWGLATARW